MRFTIFLVAIAFVSCTADHKPSLELSRLQDQEILETKNVQIVKDFYEYLDTQDTVAVKKLIAEDFAFYFGSSEQPVSFYQLGPMIKNVYSAFPDYKHTIEIIFASGEYVTSKLSYTGTHSNTYLGLDPTGRKIQYKGIFILKLRMGLLMKCMAGRTI